MGTKHSPSCHTRIHHTSFGQERKQGIDGGCFFFFHAVRLPWTNGAEVTRTRTTSLCRISWRFRPPLFHPPYHQNKRKNYRRASSNLIVLFLRACACLVCLANEAFSISPSLSLSRHGRRDQQRFAVFGFEQRCSVLHAYCAQTMSHYSVRPTPWLCDSVSRYHCARGSRRAWDRIGMSAWGSFPSKNSTLHGSCTASSLLGCLVPFRFVTDRRAVRLLGFRSSSTADVGLSPTPWMNALGLDVTRCVTAAYPRVIILR